MSSYKTSVPRLMKRMWRQFLKNWNNSLSVSKIRHIWLSNSRKNSFSVPSWKIFTWIWLRKILSLITYWRFFCCYFWLLILQKFRTLLRQRIYATNYYISGYKVIITLVPVMLLNGMRFYIYMSLLKYCHPDNRKLNIYNDIHLFRNAALIFLGSL